MLLEVADPPQPLPAGARRQAVLVLGMHRSGTSAVGGVLAALGVQAPRTPLGASRDNPRGYFESAELVRFHDRMLEAIGGSWRDWVSFDPHWLQTPDGQAHIAEAAGIVTAEFGDAPMLLLKDPRICRLVPFWLAVFQSLDMQARVVMPLRHPLEVARSLGARDGFGLERSLLLWLRHVLDAESATRALPRTVVAFDDLLVDWRAQTARMARDLGVAWPLTVAQAEAGIGAHLAPDLRHHDAGGPAVFDASLRMGPLAGWVEDTWQALLSLRDPHPLPKARAVLDTVRQAFDLASTPFAQVSREQDAKADRDIAAARERIAHRNHVLELELKRVRTALARETQAREALQAQAAGLSEQSVRHHDALLAREAELTRRHSELDALKRESARAAADTLQRVRSLRGRLATHAATTAGKPAAAAAPAGLRAEFDEVEQRLDGLLKRHAGVIRQRTLDVRELARQNDEVARLQSELAAIQSGLAWRVSAPLRRLEAWLERRRASRATSADTQLIEQSGWFDADWYLREYPDVAERALDPGRHYLEFGAAEGRNPGPKFDTRFYLETYRGRIAPGMNPLVHFLRHGQPEALRPHPTAA
jgi:hypothetical protein